MKKIEIIDYFETNGVEYDESLSYQDLLKFYKQVKNNIDVVNEIDEFVEEKILDEQLTEEQEFQLYRVKLTQKILPLMEQLKGKSNCTQKQLGDMFRLYNQYYKRQESPTCSPCVARVYQQMMKIYKKYR